MWIEDARDFPRPCRGACRLGAGSGGVAALRHRLISGTPPALGRARRAVLWTRIRWCSLRSDHRLISGTPPALAGAGRLISGVPPALRRDELFEP